MMGLQVPGPASPRGPSAARRNRARDPAPRVCVMDDEAADRGVIENGGRKSRGRSRRVPENVRLRAIRREAGARTPRPLRLPRVTMRVAPGAAQVGVKFFRSTLILP